jgi:hypothetical protein
MSLFPSMLVCLLLIYRVFTALCPKSRHLNEVIVSALKFGTRITKVDIADSSITKTFYDTPLYEARSTIWRRLPSSWFPNNAALCAQLLTHGI